MLKKIIFILIAVICSIGIFRSIVAMKQRVDILIVNGRIYTVDEQNSVEQALAIRGNRIVAVGSNKDIQNRYTSQNIINVAGKAVYPGFIDAHAHMMGLGRSLLDLNLVGTTSVEQITAIVAKKVSTTKAGEWIRGRGWDQNDWSTLGKEKPFPIAAMLDKVSPNNPVVLKRIDGHVIWVNTKAMERAGLLSEVVKKEIDGGKILRDAKGKPTGIFIDNAIDVFDAVIPQYSKEEQRAALKLALSKCVEVGLTSVHDMGITSEEYDVYKELLASAQLPIRVNAAIDGTHELWNVFLRTGPFIDLAQHKFTVRTIKMYMDGALGSRGAALIEPYSDEPGNRGLTLSSQKNIVDVSVAALKHGFQVATHAIGDRANNIVLNSYEQAMKKFPDIAAHARFRIEHAQVLSPTDIPRFKKLGVLPSMQPTHCTSDMYWAQTRLGPQRVHGAYAWRSLLDDGNYIASGSDFPVEAPNPLWGIYAAITRQDKFGMPQTSDDVVKNFQLSPDGIKDSSNFAGGWYPNQRMTRDEALRSFTMWGAYAEYAEQEKGSLERGKLADVIILSKDIMIISPREILTTDVEYTIVGGKVEYCRK